jgi:Phage tail tube protein, GTA-gp10
MANKHRGEVEAILDGIPYKLCLTLGALAELESAFGDSDMLALAERFQTGRLSARDATRVIGAGLRGAGYAVDDDNVARMRADNGAAGIVGVIAQLLAATFGGPAGAVAAEIITRTVMQPLRASAEEPSPLPISTSHAQFTGTQLPFPGPPLPFHGPPLPFPGPR